MTVVAETSLSRFARRARHGVQLALTPSRWRDEIEYLRRGPSPAAPSPASAPLPATPWRPIPATATAYCIICGWQGDAFQGDRHVEGQLCCQCGSSARDRFLFFCFVSRTPKARWRRVLETSPRLDARYREAMNHWFVYTASDYDESMHRAAVRLDLQAIDLPPRSLDIVLTAHVLEHVPDTERALAGLRTVLAAGGRLYLQVPVLEGYTIEPRQPEFHEDHTPVAWRFGFDLADRMRSHGFATTVLATASFVAAVRTGDRSLVGGEDSEWDVPAMMATAKDAGLVSVLDQVDAQRLGLWESYQFVTFEGVVPPGRARDTVEAWVRRAWCRVRS